MFLHAALRDSPPAGFYVLLWDRVRKQHLNADFLDTPPFVIEACRETQSHIVGRQLACLSEGEEFHPAAHTKSGQKEIEWRWPDPLTSPDHHLIRSNNERLVFCFDQAVPWKRAILSSITDPSQAPLPASHTIHRARAR